MKKNLDSYGETLFHLINFRSRQFRDSRSMIGIDYESFIILSTVGAHHLAHNTKQGSNWDSVWETTRQKHVGEFLKVVDGCSCITFAEGGMLWGCWGWGF